MPRRAATASGVTWKEPPTSSRPNRRGKYTDLLDELRANPGVWGLIDEEAKRPSLVPQLNKGHYSGTYEGEFEATSRTNEDGETFSVFARYIGD